MGNSKEKVRNDISKMSQGTIDHLNRVMASVDHIYQRQRKKKMHVRVLYHGSQLEDGIMTLHETKTILFEYGKCKKVNVSFDKAKKILRIRVR